MGRFPSEAFDSDAGTRARMSRIRRRDTRPELMLRRALHARGWRYFVDRPVAGVSRCRPDLLFPRLRVAVFVDGCFWHWCPLHTHLPVANAAYWQAKLMANRQRDAVHDEELQRARWTVVRVWEHEPLVEAVATVEAVLRRARDACEGPRPRATPFRRGEHPSLCRHAVCDDGDDAR